MVKVVPIREIVLFIADTAWRILHETYIPNQCSFGLTHIFSGNFAFLRLLFIPDTITIVGHTVMKKSSQLIRGGNGVTDGLHIHRGFGLQ